MKKFILLFIALTSTVFADPCTYLDRRQCKFEKAFCEYQEPVRTKGHCSVTREEDENNPQVAYSCHAVQGVFWIERKESERENYCLSSRGCTWNPSRFEEGGCYIREEILR